MGEDRQPGMKIKAQAFRDGQTAGRKSERARSADLLRPVVQEMREFPNNVFGDWADRIEKAIAGEGRDE